MFTETAFNAFLQQVTWQFDSFIIYLTHECFSVLTVRISVCLLHVADVKISSLRRNLHCYAHCRVFSDVSLA